MTATDDLRRGLFWEWHDKARQNIPLFQIKSTSHPDYERYWNEGRFEYRGSKFPGKRGPFDYADGISKGWAPRNSGEHAIHLAQSPIHQEYLIDEGNNRCMASLIYGDLKTDFVCADVAKYNWNLRYKELETILADERTCAPFSIEILEGGSRRIEFLYHRRSKLPWLLSATPLTVRL